MESSLRTNVFARGHAMISNEIAWKPVHREARATLDHLVRDYVGHLQRHLAQIGGLGD